MWYRCPLRRQRDSRLSLRRLRRVLVMPAHELMQGEGDLVGMRCAPGNNALELDGIVEDGADFHQFGFDDLWVSHRNSSMAHVGTWKPGDHRDRKSTRLNSSHLVISYAVFCFKKTPKDEHPCLDGWFRSLRSIRDSPPIKASSYSTHQAKTPFFL